MGLYRRKDSPWWWMYLEAGKGERGIHLSTKVPIDAATSEKRHEQRASALAIYRAHMTDRARVRHKLPPLLEHPTKTFQQFSEWYEATVVPQHRGKERELTILARLRPFFGAFDLQQITTATVHDYERQRLAKGRKPRTVNREIALLKSILREAVGAGHIDASPLAGRAELRAVKPKKRILSAADEARLLDKLAPADRALYVVAVDTLMRMSNVLNLTRAEDQGTHLALIDSKTGPYDVPLSARARKALDALPDTGPYFFEHRRTAKTDRDRRGVVRRMLQRACAKCQPPIPYGRAAAGVTFHSATRATGATRMLRAQVDPKTVQAIGNWASFHQMGEYLEAVDMAERQTAVNQIAPPGEPPSFTPVSRETKPEAKRILSRKKMRRS